MTITATETSITLAGPESAIASLSIDGDAIDFTAYDGTLSSTTAGTPYTLSLAGFENQDAAFYGADIYPFFVKDETNFNYIDDDGVWGNKMRVGEIDSYTLTINQDWVDPETVSNFSVTVGDKLELLDSELQGNVIRIYVTASENGRESVRFDFETDSRSDHVFVYADILR